MFKISYRDVSGAPHEWRLNTNWQYIVIGGVILVAVILDQVTTLYRDRKAKLRVAGRKKNAMLPAA
jgi:hypothetical protein